MHNSPKDIFGKIYFLYDFCCAKTCLFRAIFTTNAKFDIIAASPSSYVRKTNTSMFVLSAINHCVKILIKSYCYLHERGPQTLSPIFGVFVIFDCNFAKIMAPSSDEKENYLLRLKGQSLPKNDENSIKIDP